MIAAYRHDPLGYSEFAFQWGEGELAGSAGPWSWQREAFGHIAQHLGNEQTRFMPCLIAVSSGHGIGKSAFIAQLLAWAESTCVDCKAIVTANTQAQLNTKTQPETAKWFRLAINAHWFDVNAASVRARDKAHERTWRADFIPWSEDNPQAFAGAHNKGKRLLVIFDEASEIADCIWEVTEGALTDSDTEIIWVAFGNPTRSSGRFYQAVFGQHRNRWKTFVIDSRTVEGATNKELIKQWAEDYGEDSDFFRVRVLGLPPRAGSSQFIDLDTIHKAQQRLPAVLPDEPLVCGVDFAWGGSDDNVVRFRRGFDARSIKPIKVKGEFTRDPAIMTNKLATLLSQGHDGRRIAMMFVDSAGIAGPIVARLRQMGHQNVREVNFGADSPDPKAAYFRDYMWGQMRQWLIDGGCIDRDPELEADLSGPSVVSDPRQRLKLESKELMKKRGIDSPDDADALALTFSYPVAIQADEVSNEPPVRVGVWS